MMKALALVALLAVVIAAAKVAVFPTPVVLGQDMAPALQSRDLLLASRLSRKPERGQIVLLKNPRTGATLLRRVIALPDDRFELRDEVPHVNGRAARHSTIRKVELRQGARASGRQDAVQAQPMLLVREELDGLEIALLKDPHRRSRDAPEITLQDAYYVLADNRNHGADSRDFGPVPAASILAVVQYRLAAGPPSVVPGNPRPALARLR